MPGAEIKALREAGQLLEALDMAKSEYQESPEDSWALNSLVWVYDAICKKNAEEGNLDAFRESFNDIVSLKVLDSNDILNNSLCWRFLSLAKTLSAKLKDDEIQVAGNSLFTLAKELHPQKPSKQYTILLEAFLKIKGNWNGFYDFFEWWGFRNFNEEDYESRKLNNGKTMMSVAEEAFLAGSKCLLQRKDVEKIRILLAELEYVNEKYPRMTYIGYYIGKLLLCIGDNNNALEKLLPFAKRKKDEFWIWQLLSETQKDERIRLACLMRAEKCRTQDDYLVNVHQMLAKELIKQGDYVSAKPHIEKLVQTREKNNWKIPDEVLMWLRSEWYKNPVNNIPDIKLDYMRITNDLLYPDKEEYIAVVSFVNVEKKMASIITGYKHTGFFNFERFHIKLNNGDILSIRANSKSGYINALSVRKVDSMADNDFYKSFETKASSDGDHLFVTFENKRLYLTNQIVKVSSISENDDLIIKALYDYNKKYEKWNWKCIYARKK